MNFTLTMPRKIWFGRGEFARLPAIAAELGRCALIVCGASQRRRAEELVVTLQAAGVSSVVYGEVVGEPTPDHVQAAAALAREARCDVVIGLGGGSAMDAAKATAAMATNEGSVIEYLENIGTGAKITQAPLPFVAVPTTAGTGAEATKNAVLSDPRRGFKSSFRDDRMLAAVAVVDPVLCAGAPPAVTAASGMDALTQLIEAYLCKKGNPLTDAMALEAIPGVAAALPRVYADAEDLQAREKMSYGSLLSGICLANAGLGAAHGIAAPLGALLGVPHGLACAVLLRPVLSVNLPHVGEKASKLCLALTGVDEQNTDTCARIVDEFIAELMVRLSIPSRLGISGATPELLDALQRGISTSMGGNPMMLSPEQTRALISSVL